jgi:hypothetical protein
MMEITQDARVELWRALEQLAPEGADRELGFRVVPAQTTPNKPNGEPDSLGLTLDKPRDGDEVYPHEERNVLLLDRTVAEQLDGLTLDVADSPEGKRLEIR